MGYFKFLDSQHVPNILAGSVIFTKLSYFRLMELASKQIWIGDRKDGLSITRVESAHFNAGDNGPKSNAQITLEKAGIIGPNFKETVTISGGFEHFEHMGAYVFSSSWGPFYRLKNAMCSLNNENSYNAGVRIRSLHELANRIWSEGVYCPLAGGSEKPISASFQRPHWDFVSYIPDCDKEYQPASAYEKREILRNSQKRELFYIHAISTRQIR